MSSDSSESPLATVSERTAPSVAIPARTLSVSPLPASTPPASTQLESSSAIPLTIPAESRPRSFPLRPLPPAPRARPRASEATDDRRWIGRALLTTAKLGLLTFIAYGLMFNFSVVRGSSMSPGIHDGDRILVNHLSYMFQDVQRGDIVVLQYPLDPSLDYIKRVIGLPGDEVCIDPNGVSVNGKRLEEPYVSSQDRHARLVSRVEPEHFFVLGDNRPHSSDSREFGQVPRENLRGKVDLRVWPPERVGTLH
jgi:signal peptidase I